MPTSRSLDNREKSGTKARREAANEQFEFQYDSLDTLTERVERRNRNRGFKFQTVSLSDSRPDASYEMGQGQRRQGSKGSNCQ